LLWISGKRAGHLYWRYRPGIGLDLKS
jgi:hypothetical protein